MFMKQEKVSPAWKAYPNGGRRAIQETSSFAFVSVSKVEMGLSSDDASAFLRQYVGSVNIGRQKFDLSKGKEGISEETSQELMKQSGIRACVSIGGDAYTHGELAGLLTIWWQRLRAAEQGLGQLETIRQALTEGRGDDTPLTRQLLKSAGSMVREGGAVGSLQEQAALIGATSLSAGPAKKPEPGQNSLTRYIRCVPASCGSVCRASRNHGPNILWGRVGVTDKMGLEQMLDQVVPDILKAIGVGRDMDVYLGEHGFNTFEDRRALIETATNYNVVKERFRKAREGASGAKKNVNDNKTYQTSMYGRTERAKAAEDVQDMVLGRRNEMLRSLTNAEASTPENQAYENSMTGGCHGYSLISLDELMIGRTTTGSETA